MEERSARWDNVKGILMTLVVFGHLLFPFTKESKVFQGIYLWIYSFHMPLFLYVSGIFSKGIIKRRQLDRAASYLVLYLFIRFLDGIAYYLAKGKFNFHFLYTCGPDWYALAIFAFLIITMIFRKAKPAYLLSVSLFLSFIIGMDSRIGTKFSLMRICVFYPFFLMGFYTDKEMWQRKNILLPFLFLTILFIWKAPAFFEYRGILKGKASFEALGMTNIEGILARVLQYILAFCFGSGMIILSPNRKTVFSRIGKNTLPVYAWHYLFLSVLWYFHVDSLHLPFWGQCLLITGIGCSILFLFNLPIFKGTKKLLL